MLPLFKQLLGTMACTGFESPCRGYSFTAAFWFADAVRLIVLKSRMHYWVLRGKHRLLDQRSECIMHNSDQYSSGSGCCTLSPVGILIVLPLSAASQQAELALQEAIRIAQESNDHVCLQHCLVRALFKWGLSPSAQWTVAQQPLPQGIWLPSSGVTSLLAHRAKMFCCSSGLIS